MAAVVDGGQSTVLCWPSVTSISSANARAALSFANNCAPMQRNKLDTNTCTCLTKVSSTSTGTFPDVRLLLAEDDVGLIRVLEWGLREAGYVVDSVTDGAKAIKYLRAYEYSVVILDWRMPDLSGLDVLAWTRRQTFHTPILMLTARDAPVDKISAFDEGEDDYLIKPFDFGELLARIRALLHRTTGERSPVLVCGLLTVDQSARQTLVAGAPVTLTPREFAIIELLIRKSPAVVQRGTIALQVWPEEADEVGSNTIDAHVIRLRAKIARSEARIETIRGSGYRLVAS
jgi:DNA-binding response OmpR family regulator